MIFGVPDTLSSPKFAASNVSFPQEWSFTFSNICLFNLRQNGCSRQHVISHYLLKRGGSEKLKMSIGSNY